MILPRLLIPVETAAAETRVAVSPETIKKFIGLGCSVAIEQGAGASAGFVDSSYAEAGAELVVIVADHDETGHKRAGQSAYAAASVDLDFLILQSLKATCFIGLRS